MKKCIKYTVYVHLGYLCVIVLSYSGNWLLSITTVVDISKVIPSLDWMYENTQIVSWNTHSITYYINIYNFTTVLEHARRRMTYLSFKPQVISYEKGCCILHSKRNDVPFI